MIDLGGYKLHLDCSGQGNPTVVLSSGAGDFSFDWALVQPQVAKFTRVCAYDRAGEAWSDLGPKPRTMYQEVFDLHRLLAAAGEKGPFVLVGQSLGGMVVRFFAMQYPKDVAGLVLVDSFHEDAQLFLNGKLVRLRSLAQVRPIPPPRTSVNAADGLSAEETGNLQQFVTQNVGNPKIDPPFDKLPPDSQRDRLWALSQLNHYAGGDDYLAEVAALVFAETAKTEHPLGNLPLIVLTRSKDQYPPSQAAVLSREHKEQQASLAELSIGSEQIIVPDSGHRIQLDAPGAVTSAIQKIVTRARK